MSTPTRPGWESVSCAPALATQELHLWRVILDQAPCRTDWLDLAEQQRKDRFANALLQQRYCAARTALRQLLAAYLGTTPEKVAIEIGMHGKPRLVGQKMPQFNLSHSAGWGLIAFSGFCEVGVDIEQLNRVTEVKRIAQRVFDDESLRQLSCSGFDHITFTRLWTRMEARQKCLGQGIFGDAVGTQQVGELSLEPLAGYQACVAWSDPGVNPKVRFLTLNR